MAEENGDNSELTDNTNEPKEKSKKENVVDISKVDDSPEQARETTRSKIASFYVYAFFGTILTSFAVGLFMNFEVKDYKEMLVTVSGFYPVH